MRYAVKLIGDTDLPEGTDWIVLHRRETDDCLLFIKRSALTGEALTEAMSVMAGFATAERKVA